MNINLQSEEIILSAEQAAEVLDISVSHLYQLTSQRKIAHHKPGGKKIYFFYRDLIDYVKSERMASDTELQQQAVEILHNNNHN